MTQHLTPEEFIQSQGIGTEIERFSREVVCQLLADFHDHALEVAADNGKLMVTERHSEIPHTRNMDFALHYMEGKIVRLDKQSILNLKINK